MKNPAIDSRLVVATFVVLILAWLFLACCCYGTLTFIMIIGNSLPDSALIYSLVYLA